MTKKEIAVIVPDEIVMNKIYLIRGQKVMVDRDLAELYHVETKALKQAVKRNIQIFPKHFMFEMSKEEFENWRSQFVTSKKDKQGLRYQPFCFSEHGVLQLANVLRSKQAKQMSIRIIEVFVKLRELFLDNTQLRLAIEKLENKTENNKKNIELIFQYIDELNNKNKKPKPLPKPKPHKVVGYKLPKK